MDAMAEVTFDVIRMAVKISGSLDEMVMEQKVNGAQFLFSQQCAADCRH